MGNFLKSAFKAFTNPIGTAVDLISGGVSSAVQANAQSKADAHNRDFVASENEKTRQFNAEQSQIARDFQVEQWNRQNEYNDPSNAMKRLTEAGLNPNLAYGELSSMATATPSTNSASSSGSGSPVYQPHTMGDVFDRALNYEKQRAEIEYIRSQARGQNLDNDFNAATFDIRKAFEEGKVKAQGVEILLNTKLADLKDDEQKILKQELKNMGLEFDKLQQEIEQVKSSIANIDADTALKKIDAFFRSDIYKSQIAECASRIHRNYKEVDAAFQRLALDSLGLQQNIKESDARIESIQWDSRIKSTQEGLLQVDLQNAQDYREMETEVKLAKETGGYFGTAMMMLRRAVGGGSYFKD